MVTDTSRGAYRKYMESGKSDEYKARVLATFAGSCNLNRSRREISQITGIETASIASVVNALVHEGVLVEAPKRRCSVTYNLIRPVQLSAQVLA